MAIAINPISVTIRQATEISGLPRSTIYILLSQRKIKAVKVGRRTLILFDSLRGYLEGAPAAEFPPHV